MLLLLISPPSLLADWLLETAVWLVAVWLLDDCLVAVWLVGQNIAEFCWLDDQNVAAADWLGQTVFLVVAADWLGQTVAWPLAAD